jgi:hypothetical protein
MNVLEIVGGIILLLILAGIAINLPDIIRYLRISRM